MRKSDDEHGYLPPWMGGGGGGLKLSTVLSVDMLSNNRALGPPAKRARIPLLWSQKKEEEEESGEVILQLTHPELLRSSGLQ